MMTRIPESYDVVWTEPSSSSADSMPCGGGGIGLNVWVENGTILFYIDRSGSFDENNQQLKHGRVRIALDPSPFEARSARGFRQALRLADGHVEIEGRAHGVAARVLIWVEVFRPVVHVEADASVPVRLTVTYENWRRQDRWLSELERSACYSFVGTTPAEIPVRTRADVVQATASEVRWYHRNDHGDLLYDKLLLEQHLTHAVGQIPNPQRDFVFGGLLTGPGLRFREDVAGTYRSTGFTGWVLESGEPRGSHAFHALLHAGSYPDADGFLRALDAAEARVLPEKDAQHERTVRWWREFWRRSAIVVDPDAAHAASGTDEDGAGQDRSPWRIGRNYQLFRYTLGCNAFGAHPTKFNGSLFTVDPEEPYQEYPPDFRLWGGGSATAQNQRLVYFPMLAAGDFDVMLPQLDFYRRARPGAVARTRAYWGHGGASFTEQMENFGLPCADIYEKYWGHRGVAPRPGRDHGTLINDWCADQYDTALEFCLMTLDLERYAGADITGYLPFVEDCVTFFDEHYRFLHRERTGQDLDARGQLVIYPGSAAETYKSAKNPVTTVTGLRVVLTRLLELPSRYAAPEARARWERILSTIPDLSFRPMAGRTTIAPAESWERINNEELPQLYPVYPWGRYGIGRPDLKVAIDTFRYGADHEDQHGVHGWKQDPIFAARLGLTEQARDMVAAKLADSSRRFPTFWGPNFDWIPDFNHGGSAAIALQEMLLQADGRRLHVLPAWPADLDVEFTLHAPYQTTVDCAWRKGTLERLEVAPAHRRADVTVHLGVASA